MNTRRIRCWNCIASIKWSWDVASHKIFHTNVIKTSTRRCHLEVLGRIVFKEKLTKSQRSKWVWLLDACPWRIYDYNQQPTSSWCLNHERTVSWNVGYYLSKLFLKEYNKRPRVFASSCDKNVTVWRQRKSGWGGGRWKSAGGNRRKEKRGNCGWYVR